LLRRILLHEFGWLSGQHCDDPIAEAIEAEIRLIEKMSLVDLRRQWSAHWGAAPRFRSADLLRRLIAWRLQAARFGGLDQSTKHLLASRRMPSPPGPRWKRGWF
jgi:hypothetical protein